ncbi:MAG TPA: PEP-CTERM sorting domain-containing protein [Tepidisphaeraceae bacterium]|nr:PEP-CTERM sorting domain-containing protein [Tepidisphaeraceae bacterium]
MALSLLLVFGITEPLRGAPTVTFTLANYPVCDPLTPKGFLIFADASSDNGGLASFSLDLQGSFDHVLELAPEAIYRRLVPPAPAKFAGFGAGLWEGNADGTIMAAPDLGKGANFIPVYHFGQQDGDLNADAPAGARPAGYTYTDASINAIGPFYAASFLVGGGTYFGNQPIWESGSAANRASVWDDLSGVEMVPAQVQLRQVAIDTFCNAARVSLSRAPSIANPPYIWSISVTGGNGSYRSAVWQMDHFQNNGTMSIGSIGNEAGNVYVMAKLTGDAAQIAALLADLPDDVDASDSQYGPLHAIDDSQFGAGGFNALFKFTNPTGRGFFSWDFSRYPGVTLASVAAVPVPEPGSILLILSALVGLNLRTRREKRG